MSYNIQALPAIEKFRAASAKLPSAKRFSKQDLEAVYTHAYNLFQQQKYADALVMFGFLTTYDPTSAKYRKGTAACHKLLGQYVEAEQHYSFLLLLDPNDPEPAVSCEVRVQSFSQRAFKPLPVVYWKFAESKWR